MKTFASPLAAVCLSLPALAGVEEPPKTNSSLPIEEGLLSETPYSLNGVVMTDDARGSGFVASHPNLFFTAAHVLFDDSGEKPKWAPPPTWYGGVNSAGEPASGGIAARGYFRWASYAEQVALSGGNSRAAFARDVALAWSFEPFTDATPAVIDFKGATNLRAGASSFITGYPAIISYTGDPGNYYLHSTLEEPSHFKSTQANYLYATHISTGPGNSGGPVWVRDAAGGLKAGGILVSGRPSESGLYGFSSEVRTLLKTAQPVLTDPVGTMKVPPRINASSKIAVLKKPKTIPDGRHKWTSIPLNFGGFAEGADVTVVRLSLTITTAHRGDLVVMLVSPDGNYAMIHDGEGAGADDLLIDDLDLGGEIGGEEEEAEEDDQASGAGTANGKWQLMVQDRLTGDVAVVTRFQLEIGTD